MLKTLRNLNIPSEFIYVSLISCSSRMVHSAATNVPPERKSWDIQYQDYKPTVAKVDFKGAPWADPEIGSPDFTPKWNSVDGKINRKSYEGEYKVVDGYPLNPKGRTGVAGRGKLGKWGPNHAVDAIVTRWSRNGNREKIIDENSKLPILEVVCIQRRDTGSWALPGGMVDAGESVNDAVIREFCEEALDSLEMNQRVRDNTFDQIANVFREKGVVVYRGYVDDYRNTDNAWIETTAFNVHDDTGEITHDWKFKAGDDAVGVSWVTVDSTRILHANHLLIVKKVVDLLRAHWKSEETYEFQRGAKANSDV